MPFMQDDTYSSRNFATLRSSELQPSFIRFYIFCLHKKISITNYWTGLKPYKVFNIQHSSVFLLNSRSFLFIVTTEIHFYKIKCIKDSSPYSEVTE